jgi:hypothetical protein
MRIVRKKSERGNAMLEFAIGFAVLWFLFTGVYQFGYAFYMYNVLQTATANAAELGSKMSYDTGDPSGYQTALQNMVVYGDETTRHVAAGAGVKHCQRNGDRESGGLSDVHHRDGDQLHHRRIFQEICFLR